jgi:CRISPR-associated protein (TIGR03986 family)
MTDVAAGRRVEVMASVKEGRLRAEISLSPDEQRAAREKTRARWIPFEYLAADLRAWLEAAPDGATIQVLAEMPPPGEGRPLFSSVRPLSTRPTAPDPGLAAHLNQAGAAGFRNPYTFVPALDREFVPAPFADAPPPSHARYDPRTQWVGTLRIRLTTLTPLLLPDTAEAERAEADTASGKPGDQRARPKCYDVRVGPDGKPVIHGTALKGALRSAYEMITASRFGVFHGHDVRLAYRRPATSSLGLLPARVQTCDDGTAVFRICRGDDSWREHEPVLAAWVPAYDRHGQTDFRAGVGAYAHLAGKQVTALHGTFAAARVRLFRHARPPFTVWRVTHIAPDEPALRRSMESDPPADRDDGRLTLVPGVCERIVTGWLSITGRSIDRKHDERLFVNTASDTTRPVEREHRELWRSVLTAYDEAAALNDPPDGMQRSRHVGRYRELEPLPDGTLVYLDVDDDGPVHGRIRGVHPVMIGRDVFQQPPGTRLPESLRPARSRDQLSAADRVFGWVPLERDKNSRAPQGGYRGRISLGPVELTGWGPDGWAHDHGPEGVELAPLSSPKPTQFRFYASPDRSGSVFPSGTPKHEGYRATTALRGRKAYWWPRADDGYWQPQGPLLRNGRHREYLNAGGAKPSQVRRHRRWIRPQTVFEVTIQVDGLKAGELGALIWLLTLPDGHALRLGGGKPLGFGAVHAELVPPGTVTAELADGTGGDAAGRTLVWTGEALRSCWTQLQRPAPVPFDRLRELAQEFQATAVSDPVLGPAVAGFLAVSAGTDQTVHYPRTSPAPEAETYRWFVANEQAANRDLRYGFSLPLVDDDQGGLLPYLPPRDKG